MKERVKTKKIYVGDVAVGGDAPISVQSMTYSDTHNVAATVEQINRLHFAGADMVRVAVPEMQDALALKAIKEQISLPLIADIHFNYKLALEAAKWVDCIRLNPGNIGEKSRIKEIVKACQDRNLPIRIGVNAGSWKKSLIKSMVQRLRVWSHLQSTTLNFWKIWDLQILRYHLKHRMLREQ